LPTPRARQVRPVDQPAVAAHRLLRPVAGPLHLDTERAGRQAQVLGGGLPAGLGVASEDATDDAHVLLREEPDVLPAAERARPEKTPGPAKPPHGVVGALQLLAHRRSERVRRESPHLPPECRQRRPTVDDPPPKLTEVLADGGHLVGIYVRLERIEPP